jgi:hypothetical protein
MRPAAGLGHRHRQVRNARLLDQHPDIGVRLRIRGTLAEDDQRALGALQQVERARDGLLRGDLARRRIDDLDQRLAARLRVQRLRKQLRRQVEVDAARTAGDRCANRPGDADPDVLGVQHAEGGLA